MSCNERASIHIAIAASVIGFVACSGEAGTGTEDAHSQPDASQSADAFTGDVADASDDVDTGGDEPDEDASPRDTGEDADGEDAFEPVESCTSEGAINVVDEGADNTGDEPIDAVLGDLVEPGAELYFPRGTYRLRSFSTSADGVTFCGDEAVMYPAGSPGTWLRFSGDDWLFDGFVFDPARPHEPAPDTWLLASGNDWEVRNIDVDGELHGGKRLFLAWVPRRSATGAFRNIEARHGSPTVSGGAGSAGAYYVHEPHDGTLVLDRVDIRNFGGRGIYHSGAAPGTTEIHNSYWENNRANVRLGGRNCVLRNTTIKQTVDKPGPDYAVWLRANSERPDGKIHAEAYGALIEDSDLIIDGRDSGSPPDQASAIQIGGGPNGYFGSVDVKNTRISVQGANARGGIYANDQTSPVALSESPPETEVSVEDSDLTTDETIPGIRIDGRDGTTIIDNCIDAGGEPLDIRNTTAQTSGNDTSGSCTLPAEP